MKGVRGNLGVLCLLCSGISTVLSASLQASLTPDPAIKGANSQHMIRCDFSVDQDERVLSLQLSSRPSDKVIATLYPSVTKPLWSTENVANTLKGRGDVFGSLDSGYLSLVLNDTRCEDQGAAYQCRVSYLNEVDGTAPVKDSEVTVEMEALPLAPEPMTVTSASSQTENVTEFTALTFSCQGNVGKPAGSFSWFTVTGGTGKRQSVTQQVAQGSPALSQDGCTFTQNSTLTLNLTRTEEGQPLQVQCLVSQSTLLDPSVRDCSDPSADFCRSSGPINVLYAVSVSVSADPVLVTEGNDISIPCVTRGNPRPHLVEWRRQGENETLATGSPLTLHNVTQSDTGTLVCTAYNLIDGVTKQASGLVLLTVVETTTPSATTTPPPTSTTGSTKDSDSGASKAGLGDKDIIIIVVVLVALVIVVAIIVTVVIVRRRRARKPFTDTLDKPSNQPSEVNTMAMQPDPSVSNDDDQPPNTAVNKNADGLTYADLQFDNKPRSRRPVAIDDSHTEYADISMPQV